MRTVFSSLVRRVSCDLVTKEGIAVHPGKIFNTNVGKCLKTLKLIMYSTGKNTPKCSNYKTLVGGGG